MKLVTFTTDLRPYQANHDGALPDDVADRLIGAGDATLSERHAESGFRPDEAPAPRRGYLTRGRKP